MFNNIVSLPDQNIETTLKLYLQSADVSGIPKTASGSASFTLWGPSGEITGPNIASAQSMMGSPGVHYVQVPLGSSRYTAGNTYYLRSSIVIDGITGYMGHQFKVVNDPFTETHSLYADWQNGGRLDAKLQNYDYFYPASISGDTVSGVVGNVVSDDANYVLFSTTGGAKNTYWYFNTDQEVDTFYIKCQTSGDVGILGIYDYTSSGYVDFNYVSSWGAESINIYTLPSGNYNNNNQSIIRVNLYGGSEQNIKINEMKLYNSENNNTLLLDIKTKTDYLPSITAGQSGGVFIAGTNANTTVNIIGNRTGNIVGNLNGNVTGSVASVTSLGNGSTLSGIPWGSTWSVQVEAATEEGLDDYFAPGGQVRDIFDNIDSNVQTLSSDIGSNGSGLTALPWNSAWDTEVQSECIDALNAYDPPTKAEMDASMTGVLKTNIEYDITTANGSVATTFTI